LTDKIYVVGHKSPDTDSVTSAIAYANLKNALGMKEAVPAAAGDINDETKFLLDYFKVAYPEKLTDATDKKVILVDHNEMAQAVDKLAMDNIVEIVDHHKIGGLATGKPIFFLNEPVGATGGIIANLYEQNNIAISKEMAGLMMSAILSDTVLFKSPTCTPRDKAAVEKLAKIAGVDPMKFGLELLKAKSNMSTKSAKDILMGDFKKFDFSGTKSGVGQVEVMDLADLAPTDVVYDLYCGGGGIALFLVWREGLDRPEVKVAIYIFALQFVFNIAWSGAFFGMRSPYYGLIVIVLLWLMILLTIFKFWQVSKNAALLLVPYILWVSFAMALNYNIMVLNP